MKQHADILVIGAGVSGMTAAWKLHQAGREVRVLEADDQVGGYMQSESRDGFILEKGPFNVIVRDPAFEALLDDFSDDVHVVKASKEAGRRRFVLRDDRLIQVPSNPVSLLRSPLLSGAARLRLLRGLLYSRPGRAEDSIDDAAARRLGPEFAQVLVSAMVSGIVAGDSRELNLQSCFPKLAAIDRKISSPLGFALGKAFKGGMGRHRRKWRGLVSFEHGLGALPRAIADRMGDRVMTGAAVNAIEETVTGYNGIYRSPAGSWCSPRPSPSPSS